MALDQVRSFCSVLVNGKPLPDGNRSVQMNLAWRNLRRLPNDLDINVCAQVDVLDMSYNHMSTLSFLRVFPNLTTLILDHNDIESDVVFPKMPKLQTLWLNHNKIRDIRPLIRQLRRNCPRLRFLSLLYNDEVPSLKHGASKQHCLHYRNFVISSLPSLKCLDEESITAEQRRAASLEYGEQDVFRTLQIKYLGWIENVRRPNVNRIV